MAYADSSDVLTDEEKAAQDAAALGTPVTSGANVTAPSVSDTTAQSGTGGSTGAPQFVNLADYVNANESVKDVGANAITNKVNTDIGTATNDLNNTVSSNTSAANTAANPTYTTENIGDILSGTDKNALTGFTDWWNKAETPTSAPVLTASDAIAKDNSALDKTSNPTTGVSAYDTFFSNTVGPSAASWLDKSVYGKSADTARDTASKTLSDYVTNTVGGAQNDISSAWQKADQAKKDTKEALKGYMGGLQTTLSKNIQSGVDAYNNPLNSADSAAKAAHDKWVKDKASYDQSQTTGIDQGNGIKIYGDVQNPGAEPVYTPQQKASFDPSTGQYTGNTIDKNTLNQWNNISSFLNGAGGPKITQNNQPKVSGSKMGYNPYRGR